MGFLIRIASAAGLICQPWRPVDEADDPFSIVGVLRGGPDNNEKSGVCVRFGF
jgi:hypothetical protein